MKKLISKKRKKEIKKGFYNYQDFRWSKSWASAGFLYSKGKAHKFNPDRFNWKKYSYWIVADKKFHKFFDPDKFNWKLDGRYLVKLAPHLFDKHKYDWSGYNSRVIIREQPNLFDANLFDWKWVSLELFQDHHNQFIIPDKINWKIIVLRNHSLFMNESLHLIHPTYFFQTIIDNNFNDEDYYYDGLTIALSFFILALDLDTLEEVYDEY